MASVPVDLIQERIAQLNVSDDKRQSSPSDCLTVIDKVLKKALKDFEQIWSNDPSWAKIKSCYSTAYSQFLKYQSLYQTLEPKHEQTLKEKSQLEGLFQKTLLQKDKLESLCRELQKELHRIKSLSEKLLKEEQDKRMTLSESFQSSLNDIKKQVDAQEEEKTKQAEQANALRVQFKAFIDKQEEREGHFESVLKAKSLELEISNAKLEQQVKLNEQMQIQMQAYEQKIQMLLKNEEEQRLQMAGYAEQFGKVQETLGQSNQLYATFKTEMERLSQKTVQLEKEKRQWSQKYETVSGNLLQVTQEVIH
jgi:chromosome segregation ATPase